MVADGLLLFSIIIFFLYFVSLLFLRKKFKNYITAEIDIPGDLPFVSIIIAGRNEEKNIEKCINSILLNNYDETKYEIIFVDDFSTDNSLEVLKKINSLNLKIFELKDHLKSDQIYNFKKFAIDLAITKSRGEIIIQTDADTKVSPHWIKTHVSNLGKNPNSFNTGPVFYEYKKDFLSQFQYYDIITTMGVTCAGIASKKFYLANGANLSFRKELYQKIFPENFNLASGDDIFLIQAISKMEAPQIKFLKTKSAIVKTHSVKTLKELTNQRLRWGTKTMKYKDNWLILLIIIVFLTNAYMLKYFFNCIVHQDFFNGFSLFIFIKIIVDVSFITTIGNYFGQKIHLANLFLSLILYPIYLVPIGLLSLVKRKYIWKGRLVK